MCPHINGPLTRYVKFRVAHAPGMPGKFSPRHRLQRNPVFSDPGMHGGTCVTHVPWCMLGSLTRGGGEKDPGIPGACTTHTLTYLLRGPWKGYMIIAYILKSSKTKCRAQRASYAENVSIWWRHHVLKRASRTTYRRAEWAIFLWIFHLGVCSPKDIVSVPPMESTGKV